MTLLDTGSDPQPEGNQDPGTSDNPKEGQPQDAPAPEWMGTLDEGLKDNERLKRFGDQNALATSYIELEKKLGSNPLVRPNEHSSKDEVAAFWTGLGRPENPDGYKLPTPDGMEVNPDLDKSFREVAFNAGVSADQAGAINAWVCEQAQVMQDAQVKAENDKTADAEAELKKEYGNDYANNLSKATAALKEYGGKEMLEVVNNLKMENNPALIRMLVRFSMATSESSLKGLDSDSPEGKTKYTREQAETMMLDPRYKTDPTFEKKVKGIFDDLYPEE